MDPMTEPDVRVDPLTGSYVIVTPWRQSRPNLPEGPCPFCPGGLEAPGHYDVRWIPNRWRGLCGGPRGGDVGAAHRRFGRAPGCRICLHPGEPWPRDRHHDRSPAQSDIRLWHDPPGPEG